MAPTPPTIPPEPAYRPFPDIARRNYLQRHVEIPVMVRALGLPGGGRVLEVGCGRGVGLSALARALRPALLVGLDVDPALLAEAGTRLDREGVTAQLERGDVRALPFGDASFDLVIDFGTCYHIAGASAALRQIVRVLAPGGLFVSETVSSQILSHPWRTRGRRLPWSSAPELRVVRRGLLWKARRRV
ncbi:MAG TPA: class I SAM-dependent methyltransferase [Gemmatimonadales bacterium]|jgi:ubiquinone/menaquinone biosynthesis C-methylase UbiE|nr:class I SAM-dependent methyltransferase [Gemmatimonadales bacterium]